MSAIDQDFVRDLIERHSDASGGNGRDFRNGAYAAIADELNATLGDVTCLPHFWTHDGTLHVELPKLPESISVRLPDVRDREVGSARVWQYALGNDGVGRTNDGLADLQAENAKLRELVRFIMHQCNDGNPRCDECIGWNDGECVALLRMRELGVDA